MNSIRSHTVFFVLILLLFFAPHAEADTYFTVGLNKGTSLEDGRPWLQGGAGINLKSASVEAMIVYLGNDSRYESSRTKGMSLSYLPRKNHLYGRLGVLGYKNIWHTYAKSGPDYYREENTSGLSPLVGMGVNFNQMTLEVIYYASVGKQSGTQDKGTATLNVGYRF